MVMPAKVPGLENDGAACQMSAYPRKPSSCDILARLESGQIEEGEDYACPQGAGGANSLSCCILKPGPCSPFEKRQQNPCLVAEDSMSLHSHPWLFLTSRTEAQAEAEIEKGHPVARGRGGDQPPTIPKRLVVGQVRGKGRKDPRLRCDSPWLCPVLCFPLDQPPLLGACRLLLVPPRCLTHMLLQAPGPRAGAGPCPGAEDTALSKQVRLCSLSPSCLGRQAADRMAAQLVAPRVGSACKGTTSWSPLPTSKNRNPRVHCSIPRT